MSENNRIKPGKNLPSFIEKRIREVRELALSHMADKDGREKESDTNEHPERN